VLTTCGRASSARARWRCRVSYARGILTGAHTHAQVVAQRDAAPATPLRFAVGDRVEVFCPSLPDSQPKNRRGKAKAKPAWFRAVVTQLWYQEQGKLEAAPYQCRLDPNQVGAGRGDGDQCCVVHVDIDELVTRLGQPPRDRLPEAIKQHCSQQHLEYIVRRHGLDVRVFGDTLIRDAAKSCSYGAFIWLVRAYAERTTYFRRHAFTFILSSQHLSFLNLFTKCSVMSVMNHVCTRANKDGGGGGGTRGRARAHTQSTHIIIIVPACAHTHTHTHTQPTLKDW
jgi:hypothetical protein